jgi:hypothetical protein
MWPEHHTREEIATASKWRLPIDIGLCRNIGLDLSTRDGGSGLRFSGFECSLDFFAEEQVAPTSLGAGGLRNDRGLLSFLGSRAAR